MGFIVGPTKVRVEDACPLGLPEILRGPKGHINKRISHSSSKAHHVEGNTRDGVL